ncbi:hypothetical protein [Luteipulveratus halotolerans]|uniref:Uncharacterized protein n=1 Tax=Luteipulveratus halotolerans TaxID=1631356 RepID=A0A0L6CHR6_9MICO|nr:hypothetical protein [Luteipulveratus halotolerans]KNX37346.1 hypothetical protein VV01_09610 [Luteipulveratus halotolerans]
MSEQDSGRPWPTGQQDPLTDAGSDATEVPHGEDETGTDEASDHGAQATGEELRAALHPDDRGRPDIDVEGTEVRAEPDVDRTEPTTVDLSAQPVRTGRPEHGPTGDTAVDEALERLDAADGGRMQDQIDELTSAHKALQGRLSDLHD